MINMEFAELIKTPMVGRVVLQQPRGESVGGTLCITGHHLIVSSRTEKAEEIWLLHRNVDAIERKQSGPNSGIITIRCKDLRILHLEIVGSEEFHNVSNSLEWLSNLEEPIHWYPFFYRPMFDIVENGWTAFNIENEFAELQMQSDDWRITKVNTDFSICNSYPQTMIVPKNIDDKTLAIVSNFRQHGRFPILSYFHKENKTVLLRSSQPMTGQNNKRCKEDERLLNSVLSSGKRGFIIDTRSQNLAQLAKTRGGGFESEVHYPQWRRICKSIERYPLFQDSFCKLVEACNDTSSGMDKFLSRLENSDWLSHIKDILNCACLVAQCIGQDGACILVHGSEGMDSTLQVTSLGQVILNPDSRTIRGMQSLIEREWIQNGHAFATRCQHGAYSGTHKRNQAPTFLLFLDCVWQVSQQFPCSFEFNDQFLIDLFDHAYSSQFGTFVGNNEKDKENLDVKQKTVSLWSYMNHPDILNTYFNPMYDPNNRVIWPSVAPQSLVLWNGLFLRWVCDNSAQSEAWTTIKSIKDTDKELRSKVTKLRRQLMELQKETIIAGLITSPSAKTDVLVDTS
ncbi:Myotubularin-related protein 9 [Nymphon striatum]|nr:Myotubularin-related protein 9 [Nymphon striatum]